MAGSYHDRIATMINEIKTELQESITVKQTFLSEGGCETIQKIANITIAAIESSHSVYLFGCGGSAADAQHIAGELVGRFKKNRRALPALAFTTNTSVLTSIANDFGFDSCFAKQVEAFVKVGDVVLAFSTSGKSPSVLQAAELAKQKGATVIGFTGDDGGKLKDIADHCIRVPSSDTPRIQECHITIGHILCSLIEREIFSDV